MDWSVAALRMVKVKSMTVAAGLPGLRGGSGFQGTGAPSAPDTGLARGHGRSALESPRSFCGTRNPGSRWGEGHKRVGGGRPDFLEASLGHPIGGLSSLAQPVFSPEMEIRRSSPQAVPGTV